MTNWWENEKVSSLELSAPLSILPTVSVENAIEIMSREGYDQLPVIQATGIIQRGRGDNGHKSPKFIINNVFLFVGLTTLGFGWFIKLSVPTYQPLIVIYRRYNFVY